MEENSTSPSQRRAYFRIKYPAKYRPSLFVFGQRFVVVDVSERGVRIANPLGIRLPDEDFKASIKLNQGDPLDVIGRVIRIEKDQTAMVLVKGIPYNAILAEQVFLQRVG